MYCKSRSKGARRRGKKQQKKKQQESAKPLTVQERLATIPPHPLLSPAKDATHSLALTLTLNESINTLNSELLQVLQAYKGLSTKITIILIYNSTSHRAQTAHLDLIKKVVDVLSGWGKRGIREIQVEAQSPDGGFKPVRVLGFLRGSKFGSITSFRTVQRDEEEEGGGEEGKEGNPKSEMELLNGMREALKQLE